MARTLRQRMRPRGETRCKLHLRASNSTRRMIIVFVLLVLALFAFGQVFG